jgi:hypothetical protein
MYILMGRLWGGYKETLEKGEERKQRRKNSANLSK